MTKVGINGLGRIGKAILTLALESPATHHRELDIRAINCNLSPTDLQNYLNSDSVHGRNNIVVETLDASRVRIGKHHPNHYVYHTVELLNDRDPTKLAWRENEVDVVIEATGNKNNAPLHDVDLVVISAPAGGAVPTFCYGVNEAAWSGERVISGASCTTNSLAPLLHLVSEAWTIAHVNFLTVHAATQSQSVLDRAGVQRNQRSVINNIIPSRTGASESITQLLPSLLGKVSGSSVRVPTSNVSMLEVNIRCDGPVCIEDVIHKAREHRLYGEVFEIEEAELVSSDFCGRTAPCIIDRAASIQTAPNEIKVVMWYDNEYSYSAQTLRLVAGLATN